MGGLIFDGLSPPEGGTSGTPSSGGGPANAATRELDNLRIGGTADNQVLQVDGTDIVADNINLDNLSTAFANLIDGFVSVSLTLEGNGDRILTIFRQSLSNIVLRIPPEEIGLQNLAANLQAVLNNAYTGVNVVNNSDGSLTINFTNFLNSALDQSIDIPAPSGGGDTSAPAEAPVRPTDDVVLAELAISSSTFTSQTWGQIPATSSALTDDIAFVEVVISDLAEAGTVVSQSYTLFTVARFNELNVYNPSATNAAANLSNAFNDPVAITFNNFPRTRSIAYLKGVGDNSIWLYFHNAEFVPRSGTIRVLGKRFVAAATSASGSQTAQANAEELLNSRHINTSTFEYEQLVLNHDTFTSIAEYTQREEGSFIVVRIEATGTSTGGARLLYRPQTFSYDHFSQTLLIGGVNGPFEVSAQISQSLTVQTSDPRMWHIGLESVSGDGLTFNDITVTVSEYISLTEAGSTSSKTLFIALDKIDVPSGSSLPLVIDLNQSIDLNAVNAVYTKLSHFDREAVHIAPSDLLKRYVIDRSGPDYATSSTTLGQRHTLRFAMWTYITDTIATFGQGGGIPSGAGNVSIQFLHEVGNVNVIDAIVIYVNAGFSGRLELEIMVF